MTLTVISGVICLISMLWLVLRQQNEGKRKNIFAVVMLVFSFPVMIAGGVMDMFAPQPAAHLAEESVMMDSGDAVRV